MPADLHPHPLDSLCNHHITRDHQYTYIDPVYLELDTQTAPSHLALEDILQIKGNRIK